MIIAICDSEEVYRISIANMVEIWKKSHNVIATRAVMYKSSEDLLESIENGQTFDLIFIATEFQNELSGFATALRIRSLDEYMQIVFIPDDPAFAMQGYLVNALRCLCKPVFPDQLFECLDIAYKKWCILESEKKLFHTNDKKTVYLNDKDILYMESYKSMLSIYRVMYDNPISVRMTLSQMLNLLPADSFMRCHRCYLINLRYINCATYNTVTMTNGQILPIGRKYKIAFREAITSHYACSKYNPQI